MSTLSLLMALLLVAYVGGFVRDAEERRSLAWSSGVEFVLLGLILGPHLLGVVSSRTVEGFEPLLLMAVGWLMTIHGSRHGRVFGRTVLPRRYILGTLLVLVSGALLFSGMYFASHWLHLSLSHKDRLLLCLGLTAVGVGSTDQALRWLGPNSVSRASRSQILADLGNVGEFLPIMLVAGLVVFTPPSTNLPVPGWGWGLIGLGLGGMLGGTVAALLGRHLAPGELWPVLLGAVLVAVGVALHLNLPPLASAFVLGLSLCLFSPHRAVIRTYVHQTERPILLPTLLLVGAIVTLPRNLTEAAVVFTLTALRFAIQLSWGWFLDLRHSKKRAPKTSLGLCLLPAGSASLAIGLTIFLRHPGTVGRLVLLAAVSVNLAGELFGNRALRRLFEFEQAGKPARKKKAKAIDNHALEGSA